MKTNKLEILEKQIRKDLPRLMELSYGCLIKFWDNRIYTTVLNTSREIAFIDRNRNYCSFQVIDPDQINIIEVIGHDISLNDVLDWFRTISTGGGIEIEKMHKTIHYWDLSKPCLADQSEKLINFLYNILENNKK